MRSCVGSHDEFGRNVFIDDESFSRVYRYESEMGGYDQESGKGCVHHDGCMKGAGTAVMDLRRAATIMMDLRRAAPVVNILRPFRACYKIWFIKVQSLERASYPNHRVQPYDDAVDSLPPYLSIPFYHPLFCNKFFQCKRSSCMKFLSRDSYFSTKSKFFAISKSC